MSINKTLEETLEITKKINKSLEENKFDLSLELINQRLILIEQLSEQVLDVKEENKKSLIDKYMSIIEENEKILSLSLNSKNNFFEKFINLKNIQEYSKK